MNLRRHKFAVTIMLMVVLSMFADIAQGAYVDVVDGLSPVGYWRLGESEGTTATDRSGNGLNGAYDGVTLQASGALGGDSDTAVEFDGVNDEFTSASSSFLTLTGNLSVSIWINVDMLPAASFMDTILSITADANTSGKAKMAAVYVDDAGDLVYRHEYGAEGGNIEQHTFSGADLDTDTWYNIGLTRDVSEKKVSLYIDGNLLDTYTYSVQAEGYNDGTLYLGRGEFDGYIDEMAVFGYELGGTDVSDIYNAGVPEPATAVLLGLGGLIVLFRRRSG